MLRDGKSDPIYAFKEGANFLTGETIGVHGDDCLGRCNEGLRVLCAGRE